MQRIKSLDLVRGFTVLFIPIVHSFIIYGNEKTLTSGAGNILAFIAEWPGAQVFMLLMGITFELKPKKFRSTLIRSIILISLGYGLNFLKFVIPYIAGGLPESFLNDINVQSWVSLLLIGDILQFAGISILILWLVQKTPDHVLISLLLAIFVCFATPFPFKSNTHLLELAIGGPPRIFFPLFPWLMYPLAGIVIGNSIKEFGSKVFIALLPIGGGLMVAALCARSFANAQDDNFYVAGRWTSLMHLGFVCMWLSGFHLLSKLPRNFLFRILEWMSKRITLIYLIQWPLIIWLMPVVGYHKLGLWSSVIVAIDVALLTWLIVRVIDHFRNRSLIR